MPVKDLVELFESVQPAHDTNNTPNSVSRQKTKIRTTSRFSTSVSQLPPPSPARFLKRVRNDEVAAYPPPASIASSTSTLPALESYSLEESTSDITEAAVATGTSKTRSSASRRVGSGAVHSDEESENETLLKDSSTVVGSSSNAPLERPSFPPWASAASDATLAGSKRRYRPSAVDPHKHFATHTPVPATVVFSRKAAPLYLPKLDNYLSTLTPPVFSNVLSYDKDGKPKMFPPMDRLAASGKTIEDLEVNAVITPPWRNRKNIFSGLTNLIVGLTGSSALATFYSLQGLSNTVQIFALILSTIVPASKHHASDGWRKLFLGTIPNIIALNFTSVLGQNIIFLLVFMAVSAGLLAFFYRETSKCDKYSCQEGLERPGAKSRGWWLVIVSFLLTIIYLPLSTITVHALVWSDDFWPVPNPYRNATTFPPDVQPLGPPSQFRDPLDFCYTTTMNKNQVNFAPVIIISAVIIFFALTVWFPISLRRVIQRSVPKVDAYTELGRPRHQSEMDREYSRLLNRDRNPFSFLYGGFRRGWGTFYSMYLFAKLNTLLIIAVLDPDNCLFRSFSRSHLAVARQIILLISMVGFFSVQCFLTPFLEPVNNASEWTSRLNYVTTSAVALGVALNIPGKAVLNGPVLYSIYVVTYGLTFYFTIINLSISHRLVKRLTRRIDFSIDIFSPHLDLTPSSLHTKRRIWQESISALFLTSPECRIPKKHPMIFAQARDSEYPPYLTDFKGSPAERHVENLKILREVGSHSYTKAVALMNGPDYTWFSRIEEKIQKEYVGPDCYWKSPTEPAVPGRTRYFGNAWWIPFPPTLVIRYDDGPLATIRAISELEEYTTQNSSPDIRRRREIRMSLRALDGVTIRWPYDHIQPVGAYEIWCCRRQRYQAHTSRHYMLATLRIKRHGHMSWHGLQLGSGFDVELKYARNVVVDGTVIGLNDDYDLTPALARFLALNRTSISKRVIELEEKIKDYRKHYRKETQEKSQVLSYRFLSFVYDQPRDPIGLAESSIMFEKDLRVRQLMVGSEAVFKAAYERLTAVTVSEPATWWYIFWDDLWRRNHETIKGLRVHAKDFDPHYPTSIAYTLLPRPILESFLAQRGLFNKLTKHDDFFHSGFLNKVYLRLNETVFRGSNRAIMFHVGGGDHEVDMDDVDLETQARPSTLGTGGGTDHDDASIRPRPTYRWEKLLVDPLRRETKARRRWTGKFGAWFGITPLWKSDMPSLGVAMDVKLENGRYVLLSEDAASSPDAYRLGKSYGFL